MNTPSPKPRRPKLLVVDDDKKFRVNLARELEASGFDVSECADSASTRAQLIADEPDVILLDLRLNGDDGLAVLKHAKQHALSEVIMLTGYGSVRSAVEAMRLGAADYLSKPCDLDELEMVIGRVLETRDLRNRNLVLECGLHQEEVSLIGESPNMRALLEQIAHAAQSTAHVLIRGESGTGKEVAARKLHKFSPIRDKPLVVVDCTALDENLMQSELFGHEKGAFTGAGQRKYGLFEVANGGTIFLDEIGELSATAQTKILRVLDGGTFRRVGGTQEIHVDVRVLSATNRDLEGAIAAGNFREDLYYRLSTITIHIPPLRRREKDIRGLSEHFLARASRMRGLRDPPILYDTAVAVLERYKWPGNVRELMNVIERLMVFHQGGPIRASHVTPLLSQRPTASAQLSDDLTLEELDRRHIENVLKRCGGHREEAARQLGVSERTLYRRIKTLMLS